MLGSFTIPAALELFTKYPLPATIVVTVEPSETTTDCHAILPTSAEAPNAVAELLIVIDSFANFAFAIEPASFAFVKVPGAKSTLARPPSATSVVVIDSSVNPFVVTFVNDIFYTAVVGTPPLLTNGECANAQ